MLCCLERLDFYSICFVLFCFIRGRYGERGSGFLYGLALVYDLGYCFRVRS